MTQTHEGAMPIEILNETPPAWIMDGCMSKFRVNVERTFWTYGYTIYNPGGRTVPEDVIAHEAVHMKQQEIIEGGKDAWWKKFLTDPDFRVEQEAQAYGVQYHFFCTKVKDRNRRAMYLNELAGLLSGPLYQTSLSRADAIRGIKEIAATM